MHKNITCNLASLLKQQKIARWAFARKIGMRPNTIFDICKDHRESIYKPHVLQICKELGIKDLNILYTLHSSTTLKPYTFTEELPEVTEEGIYSRLSYILQVKKIKQAEFARYVGLRYGTINDICHDRINFIQKEHLYKICTALNITDLNVFYLLHY